MNDGESAETKATNDAIRDATKDGVCRGCGRKLVLDDKATVAAGDPRYRIVGGRVPHDPVSCVATHEAPVRGTDKRGGRLHARR